MRVIMAIFLPWLMFFSIDRMGAGVVCIILQLTLIGWLPATLWALLALSHYRTNQQVQAAILKSLK